MARFEIRTPTYKRPQLLARALRSLLAQTHQDWVCRILDDDPSGEALSSLSREFTDSRIRFEANPRNLGVGRNIDQAFALPALPGSHFLSVLEDDNYYLPACLEENGKIFASSNTDVVLRNQLAEKPTKPDSGEIYPGDMFTFFGPDGEGMVDRHVLWANLFHSVGASNISIFWRAGRGIALSTAAMTEDPSLQEKLRVLCLDRDAYVAREPLAVWRDNGAQTFRRKMNRRRALLHLDLESRLFRGLYQYLAVRGYEPLIWCPPGTNRITAESEKFFVTRGLPFRSPSHFRPAYRRLLETKYAILRMLAAAISTRVHVAITERGIGQAENRSWPEDLAKKAPA